MSKSISSSNQYAPTDNFVNMTIKNFVWAIIGLILGLIINNIVVYLSIHLNIEYLFVQNVIQIGLCSILLALIHTYYNYFGWTFQNITPGLFFISLFFGVQYKLLTNIQNTYIIYDNKIN